MAATALHQYNLLLSNTTCRSRFVRYVGSHRPTVFSRPVQNLHQDTAILGPSQVPQVSSTIKSILLRTATIDFTRQIYTLPALTSMLVIANSSLRSCMRRYYGPANTEDLNIMEASRFPSSIQDTTTLDNSTIQNKSSAILLTDHC
jgi:hypothetical protein